MQNLTFWAYFNTDYARNLDKLLDHMQEKSMRLQRLKLLCNVGELTRSITERLTEAYAAGLLDEVGVYSYGQWLRFSYSKDRVVDLSHLAYSSNI